MKVRDVGRMLGLKKTESYWLVHKGYFKTLLICGNMRVDMDSFEEWYDSQFHYKKVDGPPPGSKYAHTMSLTEMMETMGVSEDTVRFIIKKGWVETEVVDNRIRILRDSFESWYSTQDRYKRKG